MEWFYEDKGKRQGPVDGETIHGLLERGVITKEALVWRKGMSDWISLSEVPDFQNYLHSGSGEASVISSEPVAASSPSEPPPITADPYTIAQVGKSPQMQHSMPPALAKSQTLPIISLICSIVGMFTFCLSCLSIPLSLTAIICGHVGLSNIQKQPEIYYGKELALIGLIIGYLVLVSSGVFTAIGIFAN